MCLCVCLCVALTRCCGNVRPVREERERDVENREREADERGALREERGEEMRMSQSTDEAEGLDRREPKSTRLFLAFPAA